MMEIRTDKLRPHQIAPAKHLLKLARAGVNAVDLSVCGSGKTYTACAVMAAIQLPTLAIVPAISVPVWERTAAHFGETLSIVSYETLRTGRSPYGWWDNTPPPAFRCETFFKCTSCQLVVDHERFQPCFAHPAGIHCVEVKKIPWKYGKFHFHPAVKFVILDEGHRCSTPDSLNGDMLLAAPKPTLILTATMACSPLKMKVLGQALGLHGGKDFYSWARRRGCGKIPNLPGFHWTASKSRQKEIMSDIHKELVPARGVRIGYEDMPGFPDTTVKAELYEVEESAEITRLHEEMAGALEDLKNRSAIDSDMDHPLTRLIRIRQRLGLLKIPLAVERTKDLLERGYSVGLFVNFKAELEELRKRLKCDVFIDGSPEGRRNRERSIEKFQSDEARVIIVNSEAGGISVSLHDTHGDFPRYGLVFPVFSAQTFEQLTGRFRRDGAKTPAFYELLLAANTKEVEIYRKLQQKLGNLSALNDGDFLCD